MKQRQKLFHSAVSVFVLFFPMKNAQQNKIIASRKTYFPLGGREKLSNQKKTKNVLPLYFPIFGASASFVVHFLIRFSLICFAIFLSLSTLVAFSLVRISEINREPNVPPVLHVMLHRWPNKQVTWWKFLLSFNVFFWIGCFVGSFVDYVFPWRFWLWISEYRSDTNLILINNFFQSKFDTCSIRIFNYKLQLSWDDWILWPLMWRSPRINPENLTELF